MRTSLSVAPQIDGSAVFDVCVRDMMPADVPEHFRGTVNIWATVISSDGSKQVTFDDSTPVQKQLIDIKYSKDTRKQFKPGLPYKGKVRSKVEPRMCGWFKVVLTWSQRFSPPVIADNLKPIVL